MHDRLKAEDVICPWVFNRTNKKVKGKRITTFIKAFRAACTKAGYPGRIPHDLRRTAVRNLVRAGIPERVAMQMTGHKTRSVFERYNIVSECDLVEAAKKLNAFQPVQPSEVRLPSPRSGFGEPRKPDTTLENRDGRPPSREAATAGTIWAQSAPIAVPAEGQVSNFLRNFGGAARI